MSPVLRNNCQHLRNQTAENFQQSAEKIKLDNIICIIRRKMPWAVARRVKGYSGVGSVIKYESVRINCELMVHKSRMQQFPSTPVKVRVQRAYQARVFGWNANFLIRHCLRSVFAWQGMLRYSPRGCRGRLIGLNKFGERPGC
jgi:hypothetical protein